MFDQQSIKSTIHWVYIEEGKKYLTELHACLNKFVSELVLLYIKV